MSKIKDFYFDEMTEDVPEFVGLEPAQTQLVLVRGLPGSGKTTYAMKEYSGRAHFEADLFFEQENGWGTSYAFDLKLLGAAHDWCYTNTLFALRNGADVVVSNTFTQMWELERYLAIPTLLDNVVVSVVELKTQYGSVHGVPEDKLAKMSSRWENIPQEWIDGGLSVKVIKESV